MMSSYQPASHGDKLFTSSALIHVKPGAIKPVRKHYTDAGLDLPLQSTVTLKPHETVYAPSGVSFTLKRGVYVSIMTRSSTFKHGVIVIPTVIDQGYTGEASIIITNATDKPVTIAKGTRLAQAIVNCYRRFGNEGTELAGSVAMTPDGPANARASNGLGSTGV